MTARNEDYILKDKRIGDCVHRGQARECELSHMLFSLCVVYIHENISRQTSKTQVEAYQDGLTSETVFSETALGLCPTA